MLVKKKKERFDGKEQSTGHPSAVSAGVLGTIRHGWTCTMMRPTVILLMRTVRKIVMTTETAIYWSRCP